MQHSKLMKILSHILLGAFLIAGPLLAYAQPTPPTDPVGPTPGTDPVGPTPGTDPVGPTPGSGGLENPLNNIDSLEGLLAAILDAVVDIGVIIVTLALIYVGFKFVVAQGNEERIKEARGALMWTVIGALILLGAKGISIVIQQTVSGL